MEDKKLDVEDEYILWTRDEVKKVLGLKSDSALYSAIKLNGFPKPIKNRWAGQSLAQK